MSILPIYYFAYVFIKKNPESHYEYVCELYLSLHNSHILNRQSAR